MRSTGQKCVPAVHHDPKQNRKTHTNPSPRSKVKNNKNKNKKWQILVVSSFACWEVSQHHCYKYFKCVFFFVEHVKPLHFAYFAWEPSKHMFKWWNGEKQMLIICRNAPYLHIFAHICNSQLYTGSSGTFPWTMPFFFVKGIEISIHAYAYASHSHLIAHSFLHISHHAQKIQSWLWEGDKRPS